jgi:hypothetical protein
MGYGKSGVGTVSIKNGSGVVKRQNPTKIADSQAIGSGNDLKRPPSNRMRASARTARNVS